MYGLVLEINDDQRTATELLLPLMKMLQETLFTAEAAGDTDQAVGARVLLERLTEFGISVSDFYADKDD